MFYIKLKGVLLVLFLMLQFFGIQGRSLAELFGDGGMQVWSLEMDRVGQV